MVSERLNTLVRGRIERTYLDRDDGYWADLVLSEFAFLEARGGRLAAIAFHQKGDSITYEGPWGSVVLELAPDNHPNGTWIDASANLKSARGAFRGRLDTLVQERRAGAELPSIARRDRATISACVRLWADVLRESTHLF
jgi:hypothetical protein